MGFLTIHICWPWEFWNKFVNLQQLVLQVLFLHACDRQAVWLTLKQRSTVIPEIAFYVKT